MFWKATTLGSVFVNIVLGIVIVAFIMRTGSHPKVVADRYEYRDVYSGGDRWTIRTDRTTGESHKLMDLEWEPVKTESPDPPPRASTFQPALTFATINLTIKDQSFTIEVADTDDKRQLGLMNRPSMPKNHGMIFVFDKPDYYSFWMKNTLIPLDIVYLDESGKIADIHPLKPNDETPIKPSAPAKFALVLNAGDGKDLALTLGNLIKLPASLTTPKSN